MSTVYWDGESLVGDRSRVSSSGYLSSMTKLGMVDSSEIIPHLEEENAGDKLNGYKVLYGYCGDHSVQSVARNIAEAYLVRVASGVHLTNRDYNKFSEDRRGFAIIAVLLKDNVPVETLWFDSSLFALSNHPSTPLAIGSCLKEAYYCYYAGMRGVEIMKYVEKADSVISGVTLASPQTGYVPVHAPHMA